MKLSGTISEQTEKKSSVLNEFNVAPASESQPSFSGRGILPTPFVCSRPFSQTSTPKKIERPESVQNDGDSMPVRAYRMNEAYTPFPPSAKTSKNIALSSSLDAQRSVSVPKGNVHASCYDTTDVRYTK